LILSIDRIKGLCYDLRTATGGTLKGKVLTYALQLERAGEGFFFCSWECQGGGVDKGVDIEERALISRMKEGINGNVGRLD
jgi:hypothetical protein